MDDTILVVSDIHGNLEALEAVLADAEGMWSRLWCLGDTVGYGPDPARCLAYVLRKSSLLLGGNHDLGVAGVIPSTSFSTPAHASLRQIQQELNNRELAALGALKPLLLYEDLVTLSHASPVEPVWHYIRESEDARAALCHCSTPLSFSGHSHLPIVIRETSKEPVFFVPPLGTAISLKGTRYLLNPGSVGQPRDGDPRASYALFDANLLTWHLRRVSYDIAKTQRKMRDLARPSFLAERLTRGI